MKKRIKTQGILITSAVIIIFIIYKFVFPQWKDEEIDELLDIAGIVVVLLGFLFRISARGYKEEKSSNGHKLVIDGPYALIRNPMYFGTLLIGVGFVITLVQWWSFLIFLFVFLLIYIPQVKKEEAALLKQFGQEYRNYLVVTPKYFPKIVSLLSLRKYLPLKLSWIKKELFSFILAILGLFAIETWQDIRLFGRGELFKEALELSLTLIVFTLIILFFSKLKKE